MRFEYPLILLIIPVAVGLLYYFTKPKSVVSFCLRSFIIAMLVSMAAGLQVKARQDNLCRAYLIDDSPSVFLDKERLLAAIERDSRNLNKGDLARILYLTAPGDKAETDIEKALLSARKDFPVGYHKDLLLFSDGNQTRGDANRALTHLKQDGVKIYAVPIGPKEAVDIRIDSVEAPNLVRSGQPVELKCRISSTIDTSANLEVKSGGINNSVIFAELKGIPLFKGSDNLAVVTLPPQQAPVQDYRVFISRPGLKEITMENNYLGAVVQKTGRLNAAYVSESDLAFQGGFYSVISAHNDIETQAVKLPSFAWGDGAINFDKLYDVIILDNVSLAKSGDYKSMQSSLKSFVSDGGGLLIIGGRNSFGLGGYQNSELEKIMPVYAGPAEDLALAALLDASGSMDEISRTPGQTKFQAASRALVDSVPLLGAIDRIQALVFNQGFRTILPLQNAENIASNLAEALAEVRPTGPTAILPPLRQAISDLSRLSAAKKHIILLSDGHSTANEPLDGFRQMAENLYQKQITVSVIATGEHINEETLRALTRDGYLGKIYRLTGRDNKSLSDNLKEDLSAAKEFFRQAEKLPVSIHIGSDVLKGIEDIPPISGYNRTSLKPNARLVASVGDNEPLLADWQYGLGRVMALAVSQDSDWIGSWNKWPGLGQMLIQALRALTSGMDKNLASDIQTEGLVDGRIKLSVWAPDNLQLTARMESLTGNIVDNKPVRITQAAAGRYEAFLPGQSGAIISIFLRKDGADLLIGRVPIPFCYSGEWRRFTPDTVFLRELAEATGGKFIMADEFADSGAPRELSVISSPVYRSVNVLMILAVLSLFFLDLILQLLSNQFF